MICFTHLLLLATASIIATSCIQSKQKEQQEQATPSYSELVLPTIPAMLTDPELRAQFLATHYWEHFPFSDTTYIELPEITEQALVNFIDILQHVPQESSHKALATLFKKSTATPQMSSYFWETLRRYWFDPNSPMRNEEMYRLACQAAKEVTPIDEKIAIQATYDLLQLSKNRVGEPAANFSYVEPDGTKRELYQIKGEYTLLFFYNPDCETCTEMKREINSSAIFGQLLANKRLQILAIYPDEEYEAWRSHLAEIPTQWMNGYDPQQQINEKQLYYLQAIPTFYLLDKEKKVVLKDVTIYEIEQFIKNKSL